MENKTFNNVASIILTNVIKSGFVETPINKVVYGKPSHHFLCFHFFLFDGQNLRIFSYN
jgi:hypothetical protein